MNTFPCVHVIQLRLLKRLLYFSALISFYLLITSTHTYTRFDNTNNSGGGIGHCYDDDDDDDRGGGVGLELMAYLTARRRSIDL